MKLSKKNIGQLFNTGHKDPLGDWYIQLVDIKQGFILFIESEGRIFSQKNKWDDWVPYIPNPRTFNKKAVVQMWKDAQVEE